jgi:predicted nucleic acid-binding protein
MPARLVDIADTSLPLPEFLVLDASLVLELAPTAGKNPNHGAAVAFLQRISAAAHLGHTMPLLPLLAYEECYFKLCQRHLSALASTRGKKWHWYYKDSPGAIRSFQAFFDSFDRLLQAIPIHVVEPEDLAVRPLGSAPALAERMRDLVLQFAVLPKDATILSTAERLGVFTVATLDKDWARADGFTVIMPVSRA